MFFQELALLLCYSVRIRGFKGGKGVVTETDHLKVDKENDEEVCVCERESFSHDLFMK